MPVSPLLQSRSVHAEIEYINGAGEQVHSDICPPGHSTSGMSGDDWRELMHACLDEWMDKSQAAGGFYIKGF